jgi:carboxypeptidase family protein/TonB-dependent receptor-like protein
MERCRHGRLRTEAVRVAVLTVLCLTLGGSAPISAQGITTAAIRGTVRAEDGEDVEGAFVRVVNVSTGYATETRVRGGTFLVQGLETGGPYRVVVRSLGYAPQVLDGLSLQLGERREIEFTLVFLPTQLDTVRVTVNDDRQRLPSAGGVGTSISDSSLRRLPTLNRDLYDFVRLVPQAGTRLGLTGAGANFRFNNYLIDGVSDRQLQGNNALGPNTFGGKTISLEAVKEYQVLLSPYDARCGDFASMLVNAVTKNGTNDLHGSAYGYLRNEHFARATSFVGSSPYRRDQFGFSLGGPVVRDRLHFFIATEFDHATAPTPGPYIGQAPGALPAMPVSVDDVTRFAALLRAQGLDPGNGGRVTSLSPGVTLFARLDIALPEWQSRVVLRDNYTAADATRFARPEGQPPVFPLSSNAWTQRTTKHTTAVQVFTQVRASAFNEFVLSYMDWPLLARGYNRSPTIQAAVPSASGGVGLIAGPPANAGGFGAEEVSVNVAEHLVFPTGSRHSLGVGADVELFRYHATGVRGTFGQWRFPNLDALANGDASFYSLTKNFGSAYAPVRGAQPSAYITDEWRVADRLSVTLGLRADALKFFSLPAYNPAVDSLLQRRTSDYPKSHAQWSPRFGFSWEPFADLRTRVRGGAGIFVGRPPLGWLLGPVRSNGAGVRTLICMGAIGSGQVPKFVADPALQPQMCPNGRGFSGGPVALVDRNLRMAESFRTSLAVERLLPWGGNATVEALYSKVRSDFLFVNADLKGPQGVDSHGRVLYGAIDTSGKTRPALVDDGFTEVIDLRNHSLGYSWSVTAQIDRPFSDRYELRAAYTYSRARDVQSLTNPSAAAPFDIWAGGRPLSGRHDDLSLGVSTFEIPHRVVLAASYAAPWTRWKTDISLYYIGESGTPFTFGDSTLQGMGDLNADGTAANDPIYVPRNANDPSEVVFAASGSATQAAAFEKFIRDTPCLRRQRGRIVRRNSCRGPWVNTSNASVRQSLQTIRGHDLSLQLEVFNVLNLLNPSWGLLRLPNATVLKHMGQTAGPATQPTFQFDAAKAGTSTQNLESGYQLQLSLRYSF